jgi:bifunctional DNA-binding transcriptional regulator/antitoxin component of YhaV-PrlF toxin-antitoxin module
MESWRDTMNASRGVRATRVSKNGQVVLPVRARRAVGIDPGDLVISLPVGPGVLLVEKVGGAGGHGLVRLYEGSDNPLRGVWGPDPDAWIDEIRGEWEERRDS